ncbi:hypothetical protein F8M49_21485 [Rhodococcus zopfii]|uniref:Lipoprotein n=1 Tax=Rhodococcus zopfii TaxID=43772 RepID=A0ABU3WTE1_9NOCA|nr:hypothetical protein [Rhodococcus zopfii]
MKRTNFAALITATLAAGLTACSSTDTATVAPPTAPITTVAVSPFGDDSSDLLFQIHRNNAAAIVETVEQRGGTPQQAIAALLAGEAETGWRSGLPMSPPATDIRDIYGWRFAYTVGAESTDGVRAATETFMANAATVTVDAADPVAYALAVQHADRREYDEPEHFFKKGQTAASEYAAALPAATAAYAELRPVQ